MYMYIYTMYLKMRERIEPRLTDFPQNQWMVSEIPRYSYINFMIIY